MPSLLHGYEYDVFISYRQNDNRSGWVTDFVRNLETELASTIKEPVSVYFDSNPDHGLLETHHVHKSLEGKLKCLVFIPVLSQTYCDPKSFAWQHELIAFRDMAAADKIGLNISVSNGNVASRILPVRIHDIDSDDKKLFESETGGVLRSVPFIFKSAGVNRPLQAHEDHPNDNVDHTFYRDQVNKVANAIKDILQSIRTGKTGDVLAQPSLTVSNRRLSKRAIAFITGVLLLTAIGYTALQFRSDAGNASNKSIAVLPFDNLSGDKEQEYFSNGMMDELLNQLVKISDLRVISRTSSMALQGSKLSLRDKADKLGAAHVIEGSVQKSGSKVRITVQLIEAATDNHIWSETFDRDLTDVFAIQTEISRQIAKRLKAIITPEESIQLSIIPTKSEEAYDLYLKGKQLFATNNYRYDDVADFYSQALSIDSNFALAYVIRANTYSEWCFNKKPGWRGKDQLAMKDIAKAEEINPSLPDLRIARARYKYMVESDFYGALEILDDLRETHPNLSEVYLASAAVERRIGRWKDALRDVELAVRLDPNNGDYLWEAIRTCRAMAEYDKAESYIERRIGSYRSRAYMRLRRTGDLEQFLKDPAVDPLGSAYFRRDIDRLIIGLDSVITAFDEDQSFVYPKSFFMAQFHYLAKDAAKVKKNARAAIPVLDSLRMLSPDDFRVLNSLALSHAYLGDCEKALAFADQAKDLMPLSKDTFVAGLETEKNAAVVLMVCKKYELAMDQLEYLLRLPGEENLTPQYLSVDPNFDEMRGLPRFKKMMVTEYKVVYD
jgi:TolB-like protein/Flp pilus assembly protein TadD